tara:strand:+ start:161 stop:1345 length:1185 start_codon:yes stop_codon:yes gene_type:complete
MAITDKEQGVWDLDQVYNKINQGGIWSYDGFSQFWIWGYNYYGQLGQNNTTNYSSPRQIPGTTWSETSDGMQSSYEWLAVKTDGTMWTSGDNLYGQLGLNTQGSSYVSSPVQIPGTTWSSAMNAGQNCKGAVKTDGTLWMWGRNQQGSTGTNDRTNRSSPTQVPGSTWGSTRGKLNAGYLSTAAIKTDGTLWAWGSNYRGLLGQNTNSYHSSPVQIGSDTSWSKLSHSGFNAQGAIKTDGTLWVWGDNERGGLAQNDSDNVDRSSPIQVGTDTTWSNIDMAQFRGMGVKTNGTLWTWGSNNDGVLGLNQGPSQLAECSSPTQIPGSTWSGEYFGMGEHAGALKTDGTAWVWGRNNNGQLGLNDKTYRSSPTQIPGTDWNKMYQRNQGFQVLKLF